MSRKTKWQEPEQKDKRIFVVVCDVCKKKEEWTWEEWEAKQLFCHSCYISMELIEIRIPK